jgi:HEPN domain-containing protein
MDIDYLIDDFAIRSFRDQADEDYISARMSLRAALVSPSLWSSHQMVEKYIKCILLLNRIPGKRIGHDLSRGLDALQKSGKIDLNLTDRTRSFIEYLDTFGKYRYLEISNVASGKSLTWLDRTAWELRRFCTLDQCPRKLSLQHGVLPPKYQIAGGYLESLISDRTKPAREALL